MYEQKKKQVSYLTLLLCDTGLVAALTAESVLLGWNLKAVAQLWIGLVICWALHIQKGIPDKLKKWMLFFMTMSAFLFYGSHASSLYDLAVVMSGGIMIYFAAGMYRMIDLCMAAFYAVMLYNLIFVTGSSLELTPLTVSRILLHMGLVFLVGHLAKYVSDKWNREEREIGERLAEMEETSRRTEDFLANVSHELRTPINAVTGLTSVMLKNVTGAEERENLMSVQRAGHRLFRQIEDILDFTEIDTGRVTLSREEYMISSLVNDLAAESVMLEKREGLELLFDVDAQVPAALCGDVRKIRKIIAHLMDNALKFTNAGGCRVRLYGLKKPYGINLCIEVSDTGIGMDKKSLEKVTERFYQSDGGRSRKAGGLGLGLSIVYGLAAAMEGFIHVESREGEGTDVVVSIPQEISDASCCMKVEEPASLCLACYLKPEKYQVPRVRRFYDEMISHIAPGLGVAVHRVFNLDELKRLAAAYRLTHLFLAKEEYEEDPVWFEALAGEIRVALIADPGYALAKESRIKLLSKPFSCFQVVGLLNAREKEEGKEPVRGRMRCPGLRVLVVDDEPMNLMVAEGIFGDYGMQVRTAGGGAEAIEICGKEEFDVIFLDHMMPQMDGVETLKHLRRLKADSRRPFIAIAYTANAVSGAREMFLREGFDGFVSKPVEAMELEHVLRQVLPASAIRYEEREEDAAGGSQESNGAESQENHKAESNESGRAEASESGEAASKENGKAKPQKSDRAESKESGGADALGKGKRPAKGTGGQEDLAPFLEMGVDIKAGLSHCQDDPSFYLRMLSLYGEEGEQKAEGLALSYEKKDYKNYHIQVHSLKSASRLVGADMVSKLARDMEEAVKRGDTAYMQNHHQELMRAYRETVCGFCEILGIEGDAEKDGGEKSGVKKSGVGKGVGEGVEKGVEKDGIEGGAREQGAALLEGPQISGRELLERLRELKESLDTYEADRAGRLIDELGKSIWQGGTVGELLREIKRSVGQFEFEAASERLAALTERVKEGEAR